MAITWLGALAWMALKGQLGNNLLFAMLGSPLLIAGTGFADDRYNLSMKWRLLIHFLAAFWLLYWMQEGRAIPVFDFELVTGYVLFFMASVALVWLLNLFNFMDGIDGIAACEAIFVATALGLFAWAGGNTSIAGMCFVVAAAATGFLVFNWPPAKIFMGDVGSGFLGITLGGLAFALSLETEVVFPWLILFGVFFVDASLTLLIRMAGRQKWYEAHCSHAYQHAARRWGHLRVTLAVSVINIGWLLPLAWLAWRQPAHAVFYTAVALLPLVFISFWLGAGREPVQMQSSK